MRLIFRHPESGVIYIFGILFLLKAGVWTSCWGLDHNHTSSHLHCSSLSKDRTVRRTRPQHLVLRTGCCNRRTWRIWLCAEHTDTFGQVERPIRISGGDTQVTKGSLESNGEIAAYRQIRTFVKREIHRHRDYSSSYSFH